MSDTKRKSPTCADCPFFKEPVCSQNRPCEKSLPVCTDFPAMKHPALDKIAKNKAARRGICNFPYVYLGLMQDVRPDSVAHYTELNYVGYRRAEMCSCDWDFLIKVPAKNSKDSGFYRRFCHKPEAAGPWIVEFNAGCIEFVLGGVLGIGGRYNTATNGTTVQYGKAMQPWKNIEAFGLFLNEKGGEPKALFTIKKKLTVPTNEHATFYPGSLEIPVLSLMQLKNPIRS